MPTYEYHCDKCDKTFEQDLTIKQMEENKVKCPDCQKKVVKWISVPFKPIFRSKRAI